MLRRAGVSLSIAVVFAAGLAVGATWLPTADARPRATCRDDLRRAERARVAAEQAELEARRELRELQTLVARQRTRPASNPCPDPRDRNGPIPELR